MDPIRHLHTYPGMTPAEERLWEAAPDLRKACEHLVSAFDLSWKDGITNAALLARAALDRLKGA